ncbi:diguanylate cyclase [Sphingomonas sp. ST-64]|uniref:diguanylate cyclase n=1 Tax=Sphingomonas plantiphila TaxID=3163295 RepID=A0ABW8YNX1_9SPHN
MAIVAGVALTYFILAVAAIGLTRLNQNVALLWLANGPLIAALLTRPAAERPLHLVACFAASISASITVSPYTALAPLFGIANIGEALLGWLLLRRFGGDARAFLALPSLAAFVAAAGVVSPLLTGPLPAAMMALSQGSDPWAVWMNWGIGHGLGTLIATPIALLVLGGTIYRERKPQPGGIGRFATIALLLISVTMISFAQTRLPLLFVPILPLIAATMVYRVAGAALGMFAIAIIGAGFTMAGHGPIELIDASYALRLQFFQFYLAVLFLIAVPFATMIAQNHRLAQAVSASEARYRLIAEHASDAVLTVDRDGRVLFASPSVRELSGYPPEGLVGATSFDMIFEPDRARVRDAHQQIIDQPDTTHRFEYRGITATGGVRWFESTARAVRDADGEVATIVTIVREVSQRKAREADLQRQASTDPMTGVLNRRAFQERIDQHRRRTPELPAALALFDLDNFKQVNDGYGHDAGDAALLVFADVLRASLRVEDVIGRLGGEEFAVLLPGLSASAALAACERVRNSLQDTRIHSAESGFSITVSAGVAPIRAELSSDEVFRRADAALYRAKSRGRNRSELADIGPLAA